MTKASLNYISPHPLSLISINVLQRSGAFAASSSNTSHDKYIKGGFSTAIDITDPIILITLAQTIVLTVTLVIYIFQLRSQNIAIKEESYQKALDDYTNCIAMLVTKPELSALVDQIGDISRSSSAETTIPMFERLTPDKSAVFGYMLLNYSLFERVYVLYSKKWIDEETWKQWHRWLQTMAKHPMFQEVHRRSQGTFDKAFQKLVAEAYMQDESMS